MFKLREGVGQSYGDVMGNAQKEEESSLGESGTPC